MDISVHRLRFSDWQPSTIKTLASDPFSCKLAVGREDGDIEIRDSSHQWYVQATAPGQKGFNLQSLTWSAHASESGRLFGISLRGFIFELDLSTLKIKNVRDSYGGAAWCMASCPRHCLLAIGCEDGAPRLFRYDGAVLEYARSLPTTGARILCIAFHPLLARIFVGCDDGCIRCFDEDTGRSLFTMVGDMVRGVSTYIWSIKVLSDSTIVTGDSRGHVQLWDGETGVLMITLHQHTAEILALAVSPDESQIFASGVDCRVTCVRRVALKAVGSSPDEVSCPSDYNWVYSTSHNPHSHDVFALEVCNFPSSSSKSSASTGIEAGAVLISGGMDTKMCSYSIEEFARTRPFCILPVSAKGLMQSTTEYDTIAVKHQNRIDLWGISPSPFGTGSDRKSDEELAICEEENSRCKLTLRLEIKGAEHLHCFALAADGSALACSTTTETRIWSLKKKTDKIFIEKLILPAVAKVFCHAIAFSADGRRMAAYTFKGDLLLLTIAEVPVKVDSDEDVSDREESEAEEDSSVKPRKRKVSKVAKTTDVWETETQVKVWHSFDHSEVVNDMKSKGAVAGSRVVQGLENVVTEIAFNADGMYLAVADAQNAVYVYDIDRLRLHWRLPLLSSPVTSLAFHPKRTGALVVTQADNSFIMYEAGDMSLSDFSEYNSASAIRDKLLIINSPISGVVFDPSSEMCMYLYSNGCLVYVDLCRPIPTGRRVPISGDGLSKGREKNRERDRVLDLNGRQQNHRSKYEPLNGDEDKDAHPPLTQHTDTSAGAVLECPQNSNFSIITRYKSLVHVGCAPGRNLVVFENPWVNVLGSLPDTLSRKRYGT